MNDGQDSPLELYLTLCFAFQNSIQLGTSHPFLSYLMLQVENREYLPRYFLYEYAANATECNI